MCLVKSALFHVQFVQLPKINWGWAMDKLGQGLWGSWTEPVVYQDYPAAAAGGGIEHLACAPPPHNWLEYGVAPVDEVPPLPWAGAFWRDPGFHIAVGGLLPAVISWYVACTV